MNNESNHLVFVIETLEKRLEQANATINNLNGIISGIGVLVALFTGIAGFSIYFFGIKPSQDAVDKLEKNMDSRISLFLDNQKKEMVNQFIDSIKSKNLMQSQTAIVYLSINSSSIKFSEEQILKLKQIARNTSDQNLAGITQIFFYQGRNEIIKDFYLSR